MSSCSRGVATLLSRVASRPLVPHTGLSKAPWAFRSSSNTSANDSTQEAAQQAPISPDNFAAKATREAQVKKPDPKPQSEDRFARHIIMDLGRTSEKTRFQDVFRIIEKTDEEKASVKRQQPIGKHLDSHTDRSRLKKNSQRLIRSKRHLPQGSTYEQPQIGKEEATAESRRLPQHFLKYHARTPFDNEFFNAVTEQKLPTPLSNQHRLVIFTGLPAWTRIFQINNALNDYLLKHRLRLYGLFRLAGIEIRRTRDTKHAVAFLVFHDASGATLAHEMVRKGDFRVMYASPQSSIHSIEDIERLQREHEQEGQDESDQTTQEIKPLEPIKLVKALHAREPADTAPQHEAIPAAPTKNNRDEKADQTADLTDADTNLADTDFAQKTGRLPQVELTNVVQKPKEPAS